MPNCTAIGSFFATAIGSRVGYGGRMGEKRHLPDLWVRVCAAVNLPKEASIDRVLEAYGNAVGRGTIQRIRDGDDPRLSSLRKMADYLHSGVGRLVDSGHATLPPAPPPPKFADNMTLKPEDFALYEAARIMLSADQRRDLLDRHEALKRMVANDVLPSGTKVSKSKGAE